MCHIGGIPGRQNDFFRKIVHAKSFTGFISQYFSKFQKEVLEHFEPHLTYYWGSRNFDPFYFLGGEISKHAAILRNETCETFGMKDFSEKKSFRRPGIPPIWNITEITFFVKMLINVLKYHIKLR